ncbi:MAG: TetR/AcrR family transcriptional regulator [Candidatus Izemoplasmatales bacterium]|jgi:AcrR family transcriptional regulator|nr:TetR/AcrR family transcriptional regulator [Candidatus Izemoplasmatales bacterium]
MPKETFFNLKEEKRLKILNAAIDQFALKPYEQVMISDIIKTSEIPRGSFYQYFTDKEDLYTHILKIINEEKRKFLNETLKNTEKINFIELSKILFKNGVDFALESPKFIHIFNHLLTHRNQIYEKVMAENIIIAKNIFIELIEKDKLNGLIKKDIDSSALAELIIQLTSTIAIDELDIENKETSYKKMLQKNDNILKIIGYGIIKGEN